MINLLKSIRQWRYPKEFRIAVPIWTYDELLPELKRLNTTLSAPVAAPPTLDETAYSRMLADVATALWRLRQKMLQPGTEEPLEEMRRVYRSFSSAWDALIEAGITIQDHTGTKFNSGLQLHVLAFQPTPGIERETVIETIRPTIYYKEQMLQTGEVIVGIPETPEIPVSPADLAKGSIFQATESHHQSEQGDIADDQSDH